jgi:class 3 adenylate cyclase
MVGNIGAPGRINYTLVGDVVNMAQRIEEVAKEGMEDDEETVVLVSEAVVRCVGTVWSVEPIGRHTLRGRHEATTVYRLH